jgi:nuclear pore complex protein Nup54
LKYAQILRNKGFSIENDEEALRAKLENVQSHLQQSEQFHGKLNQLWAQLQLVRESSRIYGGDEDDKGWASVSEKDMQTISKVKLKEQCLHVLSDSGYLYIFSGIGRPAKRSRSCHENIT